MIRNKTNNQIVPLGFLQMAEWICLYFETLILSTWRINDSRNHPFKIDWRFLVDGQFRRDEVQQLWSGLVSFKIYQNPLPHLCVCALFLRVYVCVHAFLRRYMYTCINIHIYIHNIYRCIQIQVHIYISIHVCVYIYIYIYICIYR